MKNEILLYQPNELTKVEVKIEDETVWLAQNQMVELFQRDQSVISRHISNIFKEGELEKKSNMQILHISGSDKPVVFYNLDVIISVGYRVKSQQGTQFRIWATSILKDHLLKGYTVNNRINRVEDKVDMLANKVNKIDLQLNTNLPPNQGIFFDGQIFDAYKLVADIVRSAKKSIVLIDNYIDDTVLNLFSKKHKKVNCIILTKSISKQLRQDADKFNTQYPTLKLKQFTKAHDRFLIIDNTQVYHIGASLKDLGKKWFAFTKMDKSSVAILSSISELV